jgi:hypothetical protein
MGEIRMKAVLRAWITAFATANCLWAADPQNPPTISAGVFDLSGRIVYCRDKDDNKEQGYRFDNWIGFVNADAKPEPFVVFHFDPRFLVCGEIGQSGAYAWHESLEFQRKRVLYAGSYELTGFFGAKRLGELQRYEFKDDGTNAERQFVYFFLKDFLNDRERKQLRTAGTLEKELIFFPWDIAYTDRVENRNGIPAELLWDGSWYAVKLTLSSDASGKITGKGVSVSKGK